MGISNFDPYKPPRSEQNVTDGYDPTRRIRAVLLCTLLSAPGIFGSVITAFAASHSHPHGTLDFFHRAMPLIAPCILVAWLSYIVMAIGWIRNKRVKTVWPTIGTITGSICALFFTLLSLLVLPAMVLAFVMVGFHATIDEGQETTEGA